MAHMDTDFPPGFLSPPDITHHKLESNFTLNVVPVRLPSRDKVPVCPCLIHEEHLLRVSHKTWHGHKMKVQLCSIGKIVKNVGRGSLADNRRDIRADTRYKICKKYNTWTSCSEAAISDIKDVSDESMMMIWCDETYLIDIQHISPRGRCQGVLVWCWNFNKTLSYEVCPCQPVCV